MRRLSTVLVRRLKAVSESVRDVGRWARNTTAYLYASSANAEDEAQWRAGALLNTLVGELAERERADRQADRGDDGSAEAAAAAAHFGANYSSTNAEIPPNAAQHRGRRGGRRH